MFPRLRLSRLFSTSAATLNPKKPKPPQPQNPNPKKPNPDPKPETLNTTINNLFNERSLDRLVSSFKKSSASYRFRCRHRIYDSAVGRLSAARRYDSVKEILDFQKQFRDDFKREGFGIRLISLYGKAEMVDDAKRTFDELEELGCPRTVKSFNALLTVFAECGLFERVMEAFEKAPDSITPNGISYNILIKALCDKGDLDAALKLLDTMEEKGFSPGLVTYNILLNAFYGNARFSDAENVWDRMKKEKIEPDIKSFNAKMRGLASEGKMAEAVELVNELKRLKLKPDIFTFNALIKGFCKDGNLEEAKKVYVNLTKNDCAPNRGTFGVLIPSLCEAGELDMALKLCNESVSRRRSVDVTLLQGVVDGLVKASRKKEAKNLVNLAWENGYSKKSLKL
nr:pentatricopeptide repeat protein AaPPR339 [Agave angustifolia]UPT49952.1 pentatricopeptide repeat protein AaPPR1568 [Agave angustifolia]